MIRVPSPTTLPEPQPPTGPPNLLQDPLTPYKTPTLQDPLDPWPPSETLNPLPGPLIPFQLPTPPEPPNSPRL